MTPDELETRGEAIRHDVERIAAELDRVADVLRSPWLGRLADRLADCALDMHDLVHDVSAELQNKLAGIEHAVDDLARATPVTIIPDKGEPKKTP